MRPSQRSVACRRPAASGDAVSRAVARDIHGDVGGHPVIMAGVEEVEAMARAPIPTPEVLWREPSVLALAAVPGTALGRLAGQLLATAVDLCP